MRNNEGKGSKGKGREFDYYVREELNTGRIIKQMGFVNK